MIRYVGETVKDKRHVEKLPERPGAAASDADLRRSARLWMAHDPVHHRQPIDGAAVVDLSAQVRRRFVPNVHVACLFREVRRGGESGHDVERGS